jgi:histidinol-phosphatase (PHP family)
MNMDILFDLHSHSTISDGGNSPAQMLQSAAAKGLSVYALTDHFDIHDRFPANLSRFDGAGQELSYKIVTDLKQRNSSDPDASVKFIKGIEIGQAHHFPTTAEGWLGTHDYDFVLASCHLTRGGLGDFYHMNYSQNPPDVLLTRYFEELKELCSWCASNKNKWFDSLAHLTYPLRYMHGKGDINLHKRAIDELFIIMIEYEIALEINTGGMVTCPEFPQVKRFRELGGRLITIGSDSHSATSIGTGISKGVEIAKAAGFSECVYYENRKPEFIKL